MPETHEAVRYRLVAVEPASGWAEQLKRGAMTTMNEEFRGIYRQPWACIWG